MGLRGPQAPRSRSAGRTCGPGKDSALGPAPPSEGPASCTPTSTAGTPRPCWTRRRRPRRELGRGTAGHKDRAPRPCAARLVLSGPRSLRCETITSASRASRGKGSGVPPGGGGANARSPHAGGPAWRPRTGAPHRGPARGLRGLARGLADASPTPSHRRRLAQPSRRPPAHVPGAACADASVRADSGNVNPGHLTWAQSQSESFNEDSPQGGPAAGEQCSQNNSEQTK